jgi:hypothetical protein
MHQEDALLYILQWVRTGSPSSYSNYGYDIYIPNVIRAYLTSSRVNQQEVERQVPNLSPVFLDAAWELCRRGIIRPGVRKIGAQATDDGSAGSGFSITPFGHQWIREAKDDTFVPTEPERFGQMLQPFSNRFGSGFYARAQEAIRCYGAHAYLACCVMCGAAAESILLATAIAKIRDESQVLKTYSSAQGRTRVENMVIGQANDYMKRQFGGFAELLKYWRDEAAHGRASKISDNEAYTSLALLLRSAMFVNDNWSELTSNSG